MGELARLADAEAAQSRVILAPPRQRREPGDRARRQIYGHKHEFHLDSRGADEHPAQAISILDWFGIWRALKK
jgi:hypothetical protein